MLIIQWGVIDQTTRGDTCQVTDRLEERLCATSLDNIRVSVDEQAQTRFSLQHMHQISHGNADQLPVMQAGYTRTSFGSYQIN